MKYNNAIEFQVYLETNTYTSLYEKVMHDRDLHGVRNT